MKPLLTILILAGLFLPCVTVGAKGNMKKYKLAESKIERYVPDLGGAIVTDMISVKGNKVDYMVRSEPDNDEDSGWAFYGGGETQEYMDDPKNHSILSVNTVANYDPEIIGFLTYPAGTEVERNEEGKLAVTDPKITKPKVRFYQPVNRGYVQINENWGFNVSSRMLRRFDEGDLVIWRPDFTIWLSVVEDSEGTLEDRIAKSVKDISADKKDFERTEIDGLSKFRYSLVEETDGKKQTSSYIYGFEGDHKIYMAIYYDNKSSLEEIDDIWTSLSFKE